jgi:TonB family protein
LNNFPLDLILAFSKNTIAYSKKHFNVKLKSHEFGDPNVDFYTNNKIFYELNESAARSLVNNLNSKREVLVSIKLKMEIPQNGKLNFCNSNLNKALFSVTDLKVEPFRISNTSNSLQVKSLEQIISEIQDLRMNGNYAWHEMIIKQNVSNFEDSFFFNENDQSKIKKSINEPYFSQYFIDSDSIYSSNPIIVDQNAEFPGGPRAFGQFLQRNLRYPSAAQRANVGGKVYVQFIVNTDGTIEDVQVLKSVGFGCDEESVRVIKSVPNWNPGKQFGRIVRSRFTQPITFVLSE